MKKFALMAGLIASSLFSMKSQAQNHEVQINALGFIFNNYGVSYERIFSETGWYSSFNYFTSPSSFSYEYSALSINSEYRFYFNGDDDATGYFVAPYLNYRYTSAPEFTTIEVGTVSTDIEQTTNGLALGVNTGRKWAHRSGFTYGTHFGIGRYLFDNVSYSDDYEPSDFQQEFDELPSFDWRLGISLGFRF